MTRKISNEETQIQQSVEKLPFADENKKTWIEIIESSGVNEELVKDIVAKSAELSQPEGEDALELARNTAELNRRIQKWRLAENLRGFGNRGRGRRR
jgi:hypothetical protein